jgi:ATP-dependent DNA helicase DinG
VPDVPALPRPGALTSRVADVFADNGPLARSDDLFEPRPGQRELATRVAATFEHGGVLLAEAGTGTGKTLAYLVPDVPPLVKVPAGLAVPNASDTFPAPRLRAKGGLLAALLSK